MHVYPEPPALDTFGSFTIPDGRTWTFGDDEHGTHDNGCIAVAFHPDGWVAVADTKNPHTPPLIYNAGEWANFQAAVREGRYGA